MLQYLNLIRKNSLHIGITNVVVIFFGLLSLAIIARYVGPEKQGFIFLMISIIEVASKFAGFGIQAATVYFVNSKKYKIEDVINTAISFSLFSSVIAALIVILFYRFPLSENAGFFNLSAAVFIPLFLSSYIVVNFSRLSLVGIASSIHRFDVMNRLNLINICGLFFFVSILAFFNKVTIGNILFIYLINNIIGLAVALVEFRYMGYKLRIYYDYLIIRDCLKYGFPIYYNSLIQYFQQRFSVFLTASLVGLEAVGYLSIAFIFSDRLAEIANPIVTTHFPSIVAAKQSNSLSIFSITEVIFSKLGALFIAVMIPFFFVISYLIPIVFSRSYEESVLPAIILSISVIFTSLSRLINNLFATLGKQKITSFIFTFSLVFSSVFIYLFATYSQSITWIAIILCLTASIALIVQLVVLKILFHVKIKKFLPKFKGLVRFIKGDFSEI